MISIICPLYNKKDYIEETIQSVVNQTSGDWEMIIIDDGSSDGGDIIAQRWSFREPKIKFLKRRDYKPDKKGGSVSRNIGIQKAQGKYLMFLDADDILHPKCIETRSLYAQKKSDKDLLIFKHNYFASDINDTFINNYSDFLKKLFYLLSFKKRDFFLKQFLSYNLLWTISNPLWKTSFLRSMGGFNESFQRLQDPELHTRCLLNETLNIDFHYFKSFPDVHIRISEERNRGNDNEDLEKKYAIFYESIIVYLTYFNALLTQQRKYKFVKHLNGYIYAYFYNLHNLKKKANFYNEDLLLNNEHTLFEIIGPSKRNLKYILFRKIYTIIQSSIVFNKLKINSLLNKIYSYI